MTTQRLQTLRDEPVSVHNRFPIGYELAPITVLITENRIEDFGKASTDLNPLHFDESFAAQTMFKKRIAHGLLSGSFISAIFGSIEGAVYIKQSFEFIRPVFIGDEITAQVIVKGYGEKQGHVLFDTFCCNRSADVVIIGEAMIWFP